MQKSASNIFLNAKWCSNHVQQVHKKASPRYTPKLKKKGKEKDIMEYRTFDKDVD